MLVLPVHQNAQDCTFVFIIIYTQGCIVRKTNQRENKMNIELKIMDLQIVIAVLLIWLFVLSIMVWRVAT